MKFRLPRLRLKLAVRLALGFAVLLSLTAIIAVLGLQQLAASERQFQMLIEVDKGRSDTAHRLNAAVYAISVQLRTLALLEDEEDRKAQRQALTAATEQYAAEETALASSLGPESNDGLSAIRSLMAEVQRSRADVTPMIDSLVRTASSGSGTQASLGLLLSMEIAEQRWQRTIGQIGGELATRDRQSYESARAQRARAARQLIGIALAALVIGVLTAWRLALRVLGPVRTATALAERISMGDLSSTVPEHGEDELGRLLTALGAMQDRLRDTVGRLAQSASGLFDASREIEAGSSDLSRRTEQTASRLQATSSSIAVLTRQVATTADSARSARDLATTARDGATAGGTSVAAVVSAMEGIHASSRRVAEIVTAIDEIALRTRILSINASVEAAHAGEEGRGFAVVAGEVRGLAQRAAEAAMQIQTLISDALERMEGGNRAAREAGRVTQEASQAAEQVASRVTDISESAHSQSTTLTSIDLAVKELDDLTQQNAALAEQSTASASRLKAAAEELAQAVSVFRLQD